MAIIKSFTDLSQSKVLAEFLPLESADMCFNISQRHNMPPLMTPYIKFNEFFNMETPNFLIPCWSLGALIDVLPDTITSNDGIAFKLNIKKNIIEYSNPPLYLIYKSVKSDNIVDACYEMILKLHEQNIL